MRAFELDFVQPVRRSRGGGALLLAAAAATAFAVVTWRAELQNDTQSLESRVARLERRAQGLAPEAARIDESVERELRRANEIISQLALPWDRLFRAVESAAVPQVTLLSIVPDAKAGTVQVSAETADSEAMFGYVQRFERQPEFANVYLLQHQVEQRNAMRPFRFVVTASWLEPQSR